VSTPPVTPHGAPRVVVCDYNALLQSVTGLLRMSGCAVLQAYDGQAAEELCRLMPDIDLLVLNTEGTGMNTPDLVHTIAGFILACRCYTSGRLLSPACQRMGSTCRSRSARTSCSLRFSH
jgi:response regulator RpfG family c-di-GMP phosphodiesterase